MQYLTCCTNTTYHDAFANKKTKTSNIIALGLYARMFEQSYCTLDFLSLRNNISSSCGCT